MKLFILLFSCSLSLFILLILYGILQKKVRPTKDLQQRMEHIRSLNLERAEKERQQPLQQKRLAQREKRDLPFLERVIHPLMDSLERTVMSFTPHEVYRSVQRRIIIAGKQREWSAAQFISSSLLGGAVMFVFLFLMFRTGSYALVQKMTFLLVGSLAGAAMPTVCLNIITQKRQKSIRRQLHEVLDMLCVSVQAGLSFDGSLAKITGRMHGPFIDELRHFEEAVRMGSPRRTALKSVAARCEVQEVSLFVTALIQAERLGTSMGTTLKNQADNMRERRRQYIKGEAMKAPVKIIFPLVLFIFPALFVVVLVPTLLTLAKNM